MQVLKRMGLDYGKARTGVAFSSSTIATADHIHKSQGEDGDLLYFANLIEQRKVDEVVFGLPLNADGSESEMSACVRAFAEKLRAKTGVKVAFEDERFTSLEAEELLKEAKIKKWEKRKEILDKLCAQIILQNYLDSLK